MKETLVLGIESSCDETSVAVVKNGREVLSNVIDTQIKIHEQFGGVVPEIASRNHIEAISGTTPPNCSCIFICVSITFDKTSMPFFTTATEVSSQLDSIPNTNVSFNLVLSFHFLLVYLC